MKSISELTDFYYKTLFPIIKDLDKKRKALRFKLVTTFVVYSLFFTLVVLSLGLSEDILIFSSAIYLTIGFIIYRFLTKDYVTEFKNRVIEPLIKEIDKNLIYLSSSHISQSVFENSKLFSKVDRVRGNDHVSGSIDGVNIEFSDIYAEKKHTDSKGRTNWSTVFRGLFIISEFNKNFKGRTVILPDTAQNLFGDLIGNFLQSHNFAREDLIKMDDIEFEKEFVVYATDQIEARYILSNSLMQKLLVFAKKSKQKVYISFVNHQIHMAIEYKKDLFEPSIFHSLLEYKVAMEYIETLHLAISIVEELKLNQSLWGKI